MYQGLETCPYCGRRVFLPAKTRKCPLCGKADPSHDKVETTAAVSHAGNSGAAAERAVEAEIAADKPVECWETLLQKATPGLYRGNAFRILELPSDASPRELSRRAEMLKMTEKYGNGAPRKPGPLALTPAPDEGVIRSALQRLHDPEQRLVDEFFWFWPAQLGESTKDPCLKALAEGKVQDAFNAWRRAEMNSSESNVSMHNIAVLTHLVALDHELDGRSQDRSAKQLEQRDKAWSLAFQRWKVLMEYEGFWSRWSARIRDFDDPRLTSGTARRFRNSLPVAILTINAQLAIQAAERGDKSEAERHAQIVRTSGFEAHAIGEAMRRAVAPSRERVKLACRKAEADAEQTPRHGDEFAQRLLDQTRPLLQLLDFSLGPGHSTRDGAHDEVALSLLRCQILFGNQTEQWEASVSLLETALTFVVSQSARTRLEENLRIVKGNLEYQRTYQTCWFCQKRAPVEASAIEVPMYGNVTKTYVYNGYRLEWNKLRVKVPRCSQCKKAQVSSGKNAGIGCLAGFAGAAVGAIIGLMGGAVGGEIAGAAVAGFLIVGFVGLIVGSVIDESQLNARLKELGIKPESAKNEFPAVKEMLGKGWSFGEGPSTQ